MEILGIDIGGSGIKGNMVNVDKGELTNARHKILTPQPPLPEAVAQVVGEMARHFNCQGPIGVTFPGVVQHGVTLTAANMDKSWIGMNAEGIFAKATGCPVKVLNDADAAGVAEMQFGAGKGRNGVVIMLTFGTGIGSAIFTDGVLVPNTEFGHVKVRGKDAEHRAAARIREEKKLSYKKWGKRVNEYLQYMELLFTPDLFIVGGGISRDFEKFRKYLEIKAEIVPAQLANEAGIVGAAMSAKSLGTVMALPVVAPQETHA
jgi:polyphosphate glucokinase